MGGCELIPPFSQIGRGLANCGYPSMARRALSVRWAAFPITLWAVTRVAILGFGSLSMAFVPGLVQSAGLDREYLLRHPSIEGLCRWDCRFFQDLANHGYVHEGSHSYAEGPARASWAAAHDFLARKLS